MATPIGNLEDITLRALRILTEVSLIAAEDTRHTRQLLNHFKISNTLISCYRENESARVSQIIDELRQGRDVALVSDAGTPCISDPGAALIAKVHEAGIAVSVVPGASSLTAALSMSGMKLQNFLFAGFLANSKSLRRRHLLSLSDHESTLVFYESPRRILGCLRDMIDLLGDRQIFVVREITKIHEEYFRGSTTEVLASLQDKESLKGEFVVILEGRGVVPPPEDVDIAEMIKWYRDQEGNSLSSSVKKIARDLGISKADVYKMALEIWK